MKRILLCFFTCFSLAIYAQEAPNLYRAVVAVPDKTSESREAGINAAFAKVIIKLTGNSTVMQSPQLQPFLTDPRTLMDAVGFRDLPNQDDATSIAIGLDVSFDQQIVDRLIRQAQLPILPSNRPKILVWIIADDISFGRRFINEPIAQQTIANDYSTQLLAAVDNAMQGRAVPYLLPIYDLEDQLSLPLNQAWSLNADLIAAATQRYKADGWFAIRLYTASNGEIRGAWVYQSSGKRQLNDFRSTDMDSAIESAVDDILDGLMEAYTYVPQLDTNQLLVQIDGVSSLTSYRTLLDFFTDLQIVDSVQLYSVKAQQVILAVEIEGRADRLHLDLLRSGKFKSKISDDKHSIGRLVYHWVPE